MTDQELKKYLEEKFQEEVEYFRENNCLRMASLDDFKKISQAPNEIAEKQWRDLTKENYYRKKIIEEDPDLKENFMKEIENRLKKEIDSIMSNDEIKNYYKKMLDLKNKAESGQLDEVNGELKDEILKKANEIVEEEPHKETPMEVSESNEKSKKNLDETFRKKEINDQELFELKYQIDKIDTVDDFLNNF